METPNLPSLDSLTDTGLRGSVDMRPTLLRVLTDLYVQKLKHTPDEERHYTELALRLLDAVDAPTRAGVASRLARHLSPPVRVIQRLVNDLPEIAAPLRSHPVLEPPAQVAETAQRVAAMPVALAPRAVDSTIAAELNELFFAANEVERRLILLNFEVVAPMATGHVGVSRDPAVGGRLEVAALGRNREDFAHHLAQSLQIPRDQARRIAQDDLGEPIAIAAKALNVPRDMFYRILMFANPAVGHSVERVHALAMLYDEMTSQTAAGMVALWQALPKGERPTAKHQPLSWNDETAARSRPAAAVPRASAAPRTSERREAS
jgi:hypothetical protein